MYTYQHNTTREGNVLFVSDRVYKNESQSFIKKRRLIEAPEQFYFRISNIGIQRSEPGLNQLQISSLMSVLLCYICFDSNFSHPRIKIGCLSININDSIKISIKKRIWSKKERQESLLSSSQTDVCNWFVKMTQCSLKTVFNWHDLCVASLHFSICFAITRHRRHGLYFLTSLYVVYTQCFYDFASLP